MRLSPCILLASFIVTSLALTLESHAAPHETAHSARALDKQVAATLEHLSRGDLGRARVLARQLARQFPRFALGQLLTAELESAAALQDVRAAGVEPMSQTLINLLLEAQARHLQNENSVGYGLLPVHQLDHQPYNQPDSRQEKLPNGVIQIGRHLSHLLLIDLNQSTLYQLAANRHDGGADITPRFIRQHYVSSGKAGFGKLREGDNKTPLGLYRISGFQSDATLPELYGSGALTLDYPNTLDRLLGRTGSGIWLHGVPRTQLSRAPRSSEGCVTMSNDHLNALVKELNADETLVMLTRDVTWVDQRQVESVRTELADAFTRYRQAYVTGNTALLRELYETPDSYIPEIFGTRELAQVKTKDLSMFVDPGQSGHVVMDLRLGTDNERQVTIYWSKGTDDQWRVATEHWDGRST